MAWTADEYRRLSNLGRIGARVFNSVAISTANGATVSLTFDSERFDIGALHSTAANTGRLTVPITGVYLITAHVQFAGNATGYRDLGIRINTSTYIARCAVPSIGANAHPLSITTLYRAVALDFFDVAVLQTSGGALNVDSAGNYSPEFSAFYLGRG